MSQNDLVLSHSAAEAAESAEGLVGTLGSVVLRVLEAMGAVAAVGSSWAAEARVGVVETGVVSIEGTAD